MRGPDNSVRSWGHSSTQHVSITFGSGRLRAKTERSSQRTGYSKTDRHNACALCIVTWHQLVRLVVHFKYQTNAQGGPASIRGHGHLCVNHPEKMVHWVTRNVLPRTPEARRHDQTCVSRSNDNWHDLKSPQPETLNTDWATLQHKNINTYCLTQRAKAQSYPDTAMAEG